jgi:hypothetical protein
MTVCEWSINGRSNDTSPWEGKQAMHPPDTGLIANCAARLPRRMWYPYYGLEGGSPLMRTPYPAFKETPASLLENFLQRKVMFP